MQGLAQCRSFQGLRPSFHASKSGFRPSVDLEWSNSMSKLPPTIPKARNSCIKSQKTVLEGRDESSPLPAPRKVSLQSGNLKSTAPSPETPSLSPFCLGTTFMGVF